MKRIFQHPTESVSGKRYWRSLNELADRPEFAEWLHREFPAGADQLETDGMSRRNFLRLMGASMALAGLGMSGCRRPEAFLVPYTKSPEWMVPGKAIQYATAMPRRRGAMPLLVTCVDGRPIKIEGNPAYPGGSGATDAFAQGAVLEMYDPDRAKEFKKGSTVVDAKAFADELDRIVSTAGSGDGIAFLTEAYTSPTISRLRAELSKKFPGIRWATYEPMGLANEIQALGGNQAVRDYAKADIIVSLDCDFLGTSDASLESIKGFADGRRRVEEAKSGAKMNRLYVVESRYSSTGACADHRLRLPSSQIGTFAQSLLGAISGSASDDKWISELAKDLTANKGKSLIVAGSQQPWPVHALVDQLNSALGNIGQTVTTIKALSDVSLTLRQLADEINGGKVNTLFIFGGNPAFNAPAGLEWTELQKKVANTIRLSLFEDETSQISTWSVPSAHFLETWGDDRSPNGTYLSRQPMILPLWGGLSIEQILWRLLGNAPVAEKDKPAPAPFLPDGPQLVQETFKQIAKVSGDIANPWRQFVHDGFLAGSASTALSAGTGTRGLGAWLRRVLGPDEYEVTFYAGNIDDGRYINNGWLQELPDPMTKLTWDNAALISPALAQKLGLEQPGSAAGIPGLDPIDKPYTNVETQASNFGSHKFPMIELTVNGRTLVVPALVIPGQADNSIALAVGYGRTFVGHVGKGSGFNAYSIRGAEELVSIASRTGNNRRVFSESHDLFTGYITGVSVKKAAGGHSLAITQEHNSMEGRGLAREIVLKDHLENPAWVQDIGESKLMPGYKEGFPAIYQDQQAKLDSPMQWGMVIDLNTCVGCNSCMIACQAENNIPVVGKEQVLNGREMHWIRNDRYFTSDDNDPNGINDPQAIFQPVPCMHCENAPCETVCPVNATVHSTEGLNVMAYNRCIGTRYCANNCPYKVRRFNFFDYNQRPLDKLYWGPLAPKGTADTLKMQKNPNVTVRMRGVIEKCTYCVQRIEEAKIGQLRNAKDTPDIVVKANSFETACQQVCPAQAIVFGNIADPASNVSKARANGRNYGMLDYLGVKPRTTYLGRVRNPNPAMPGAEKVGTASPIHHHGGGHGEHAPAHGAETHSETPASPAPNHGGHH